MNYNNWYYNNGYDKSPSWSGVEFLYDFLIKNKGYGPRGIASSSDNVEIGDIAQLSFDVFGKKISDYNFVKIRFVHIKDVGY